jgi:hypothetical protein
MIFHIIGVFQEQLVIYRLYELYGPFDVESLVIKEDLEDSTNLQMH